MENLIKRLTDSVAFAEKEGENMDDVSWGMQEGVLISCNEAKFILKSLSQQGCVRLFLENISKEKNIPIERLMAGILQGDLYVWDYDSGRHYQDQFRVVSINNK